MTSDIKSDIENSNAAAAARSLRDDLTEKAHSALDEAKDRAQEFSDTQRGRAADGIASVADTLRRAASDMSSGSPQERTFAQIASGLADASDKLRNKDIGELASELSDFARRNPLVFLGGAALLGLTAARIAKASDRRPSPSRPQLPAVTGAPQMTPHTSASSGMVTPAAAPYAAATNRESV